MQCNVFALFVRPVNVLYGKRRRHGIGRNNDNKNTNNYDKIMYRI